MNIIETFAGRTALRVRRFLKKTPMDLRLAVKEDIPGLVRLRLEYLKVEKPEVNALKEGLLALSLGNYFMRHLSTGDLVCWVAEFEGREPGYRNDELEQELFARLLEEAESRNVGVITVQEVEMGRGEIGISCCTRRCEGIYTVFVD